MMVRDVQCIVSFLLQNKTNVTPTLKFLKISLMLYTYTSNIFKIDIQLEIEPTYYIIYTSSILVLAIHKSYTSSDYTQVLYKFWLYTSSLYTCILLWKTFKSNLMRTACFWNKLPQVRKKKWKIAKPNNFQSFGSNKTKGSKQDSQSRLRLPFPFRGEP